LQMHGLQLQQKMGMCSSFSQLILCMSTMGEGGA